MSCCGNCPMCKPLPAHSCEPLPIDYRVGNIIIVEDDLFLAAMDMIKAMQSRDTGIPKQVMVAMSCIQAAHEIVKDIKDVKKEAAIKSKHIDRAQWKNRQRYHNR